MEKLLIMAGSGTYPECILEGARKAGAPFVGAVAIKGMTSHALARKMDVAKWFGIGEVGAIYDWVVAGGFTSAILAGQITPVALFRTRFDSLARKWLRGLSVKNAHTIYGKIADEFEKAGIHVLPASCYMDDCIPGAGALTKRAPDEREARDIALGHRIAEQICDLDIGQTLLVKDGMILAVEAFEGTNKAIRRGGKLGGKGAVVVKVAKAKHDMRFDIPVIGRGTISALKRAGATALAFQAHRLVMLEREEVIAAADRLGIAIVGLETAFPPAPLRP